MFEKEIKFLYDLTITKMKPLGNSFYLSQLQDVGVHPAIIHYISCELDYLIYEDRQKLLKNSAFDYYGEKIDTYFELITEEIKKNKKFQFNLIQKYILTSVAFNVNYVCNPHQTLIKFLFSNQEEKKLKEISLFLNYLYYNDYYKKIILTYLNKKKYITVNKQETAELIKKIDKINLETNSISIIQQALTSISDFFNYGKSYKNNVPVSSIETWFADKDLSNNYNHLTKLMKLDTKSVVTIQEVIKVVNEKDILNSQYNIYLVDLSDKSETEEIEEQNESTNHTNIDVNLGYEETNLETQIETETKLEDENILEVKLEESIAATTEEKSEAESIQIQNDNQINFDEQEKTVQEITIEEINKSKELSLSDLLADLPELNSSLQESSEIIENSEIKANVNEQFSNKNETEEISRLEDEIEIFNDSKNDEITQPENIISNELNIPYEKKIKILDLSNKDENPDYYISEKKVSEHEKSNQIEDSFVFNEAEIQKEFEAMQKALIEPSFEDLQTISEKNKQLINELEKELEIELDENITQNFFDTENNNLLTEDVLPLNSISNVDIQDNNSNLIEICTQTSIEYQEKEEIIDLEITNNSNENITLQEEKTYKNTEVEIDFENIEDEEHLIVTDFINENNLINENKEINLSDIENDFEVFDNEPIFNNNLEQKTSIFDIVKKTEIHIEEEIDFEKLENIESDETIKKSFDDDLLGSFTENNLQEEIELENDSQKEKLSIENEESSNEVLNTRDEIGLNFKDLDEEIDLEKKVNIFDDEVTSEVNINSTNLNKTKNFKIEIDMIDLLEHRKIPEIIEVMFDYDMEEFTNLIESVQLSEDYINAESVIDKFCVSHHVKRDSKETILFKDLIKKYFNEG